MSSSLTAHLLSFTSSPSYRAATTHPFLRHAGQSTVLQSTFLHWLYQDRIYAAHAYPRFIGQLIAKIPFDKHDLARFGGDVTSVEKRNRRILECLTFSLGNVVREVNFFEQTAGGIDGVDKVGGEVEVEREATRNYCSEMARVASLGTLEEGLVFLWAMEKVYLDSWSFAEKQTSKSPRNELGEFINNWTSEEFVRFVDDLEKLVDMMDIKPGSDGWRLAEATWNRVLELEIAFWPDVTN